MTNQNIVLPAIALRGTTILPGMIVHFDVSRERSVKAIEAAMLHDQKIFLVTQIDPEVESPNLAGVYHVGTIAYIKQVVKLPQNLLRVLVEGTGRATLVKFEQEFPFIRSEITPVDEEEMQMPEPVMEAMHRSLKELFHRYCMENGKVSKELVAQILNIDNVEELVEQIAVNIPLSYQNKQKILEALTLEERYEVLGAILGNEIEIMQIGRDLQKKVKARIDKNQREYILREQLKLIREELGEDNTADDAEEFKKKLQELQAGDEVKEKISKEIERFKNTNSNVSENAVLRGYIETMLALPWEKKSTDSDDLKEAWKVLQEGHYGLKDVKERVMEFLSVRKLTHKGKSPILCLVGPPGTGKTSIARSIAEAMHKKYVRICLGGVRDEAEIRGHRKTYVGAMPGRITAALQQAGVSNPLMLLDEIDKTSSDYKGDTSAALLEVLDPEQNSRFMDHYIEVPQDLSEVLFIATANDVQGIPRPLLDRMELIEIAGYTENEKEHIAKEHLIPKQMEENGIEKGKLTIQSAALKKIINNYTKEAGVRNLERTIGQICRKTARLIMEEDKKKVAARLHELVEKDDYHLDVGLLGSKALLSAMSDNGYAETAYKVASQDTYPSWGYWIKQGATTLHENWRTDVVIDNSYNHIMFGEIGAWLYKGLGGIQIDEKHPGFKHVLLKPFFPSDMNELTIRYNTPYGWLNINWVRQTNDCIRYTIDIPAGTSVTFVPFTMPESPKSITLQAGKHSLELDFTHQLINQ